MAIEIILLAVMVVGVAIKWTTTVSIRDRHAKLADANETYSWRRTVTRHGAGTSVWPTTRSAG